MHLPARLARQCPAPHASSPGLLPTLVTPRVVTEVVKKAPVRKAPVRKAAGKSRASMQREKKGVADDFFKIIGDTISAVGNLGAFKK